MKIPRRNNAIVIGLWLNAVLLALVLMSLLSRDSAPAFLPAAIAQMQATEGGAAGVQIVPAQLASGHWGCYVLDTQSRRLTVYQYLPGDRQLRLVAARDVRHDLRLNDFNTAPSPREIQELVEQQQVDRPQRPD